MVLNGTDLGAFRVTMPFKERTVNNANAIRTPQAIPCPEATDLDPDYHPCAKTNRRAVLLITILGSSLASLLRHVAALGFPGSKHGTLTNYVEPFVASEIRWP